MGRGSFGKPELDEAEEDLEGGVGEDEDDDEDDDDDEEQRKLDAERAMVRCDDGEKENGVLHKMRPERRTPCLIPRRRCILLVENTHAHNDRQ
mmetsp:Transcript_53435/g.134269  ORF Transcript_53435/g.134269 Transcript_53435/m.134269 type:complete len:93 (-) Transcript_53435:40-318(-)